MKQALIAKAGRLRTQAERLLDRVRVLVARLRSGSLLTSGALLFISMTIVNAGNYLFNLILGRWLGPAAFADLSLIITLMLMVTLITASLQTISAKFAANHTAIGDMPRLEGMRRWMGRRAWIVGALLLAGFALGAPVWQEFFQTASAWPFVMLGGSLPLYFAMGVDRGVLQGQTRFGVLAVSYQAEMWARLIAAMFFVSLGWSVNGAVGGVVLSLGIAWLAGRLMIRPPAGQQRVEIAAEEQQEIGRFAGPVIAALIGQVLISNSDILIVKHFFAAEPSGHYAALALIGRIVFFATASVVAAMFPIVAQKHKKGEPHGHLLALSLGVVLIVSAAIIAVTLAIPELLVHALFGAAYLSIAPLLWLYALATALYALANVIVHYRLSAGNGGGSVFAVVAGVAQAVGLWFFHAGLLEVVLVQVYLMAILFVALLMWDVVRFRAAPGAWRSIIAVLFRPMQAPKQSEKADRQQPTAQAPDLQLPAGAVLSQRSRRPLAMGLLTLLLFVLMWQITH